MVVAQKDFLKIIRWLFLAKLLLSSTNLPFLRFSLYPRFASFCEYRISSTSVFVYMIPVRVIPVWVHSGSRTLASSERSYRNEIWPYFVPEWLIWPHFVLVSVRWVAELTGAGSACVSIGNNAPKWLVRARAHMNAVAKLDGTGNPRLTAFDTYELIIWAEGKNVFLACFFKLPTNEVDFMRTEHHGNVL